MLNLQINTIGEIQINQKMMPPSVYLDHWAMMTIAETPAIATKFKEVLLRRQGTLMISWMNLLEFSEITIKHQVDRVEDLLESISPNLGFIDVIPKNVIERENKYLQGQRPVAPHIDSKLLYLFGTIKRFSLDPLNPRGLFSNLNDLKIKAMNRDFHLQFSSEIKRLRGQAENDSKYNSQIRKIPQGKDIHAATRYIARDILNSLVRDKGSHLPSSNDWRDFYHTVVPIAYCNYVLLDKYWSHKAKETIARLCRSGFSAEMAEVFSSKDMNEFWAVFDR